MSQAPLPRSDQNDHLSTENSECPKACIYVMGRETLRELYQSEGSLMLSPPPAQEIRAPGNGGVSVQYGEENIGIIDWTLNAAPFWKLKFAKSTGVNAQTAPIKKQHQPRSLQSNWLPRRWCKQRPERRSCDQDRVAQAEKDCRQTFLRCSTHSRTV